MRDPVGHGVPASGEDKCPENEVAVVYRHREFNDLDALSERLAGYDQKYLQTSTGQFRGSRTSAYLEDGVSVHLQRFNCAMHVRISCPEDSIGLAVSLGAAGTAVNGIELTGSDLLICRPGSDLEVDVSAEGGAFLFLSLELRTLEYLIFRAARERLDPERRETSVVRNAYVAGALEAHGTALLRASGRASDGRLPKGMATALVTVMVASLDLQAGLDAVREREDREVSFATFVRARAALAVMEEFDQAALAAATGRSVRSVQLAFAKHARTTPLRYFCAFKLHRVRDVLLAAPGARKPTIGDIAAAHGFSSWSRFTQLYRRQFGETPSETRARARGARAPRALSGLNN